MIKTYAQKITQSKRKELLEKVENAINFHEKFRHSYLFKPPLNANSRRNYEKYYQRDINFVYNHIDYRYCGYTSCSCKRVYYDGTFYENGEIKTVRVFKKIRDELISAIEAYDDKHTTKLTQPYISEETENIN